MKTEGTNPGRAILASRASTSESIAYEGLQANARQKYLLSMYQKTRQKYTKKRQNQGRNSGKPPAFRTPVADPLRPPLALPGAPAYFLSRQPRVRPTSVKLQYNATDVSRRTIAALAVCLWWTAAAQSLPPGLQLHGPVDRELGPGQTDVFTVEAAADQYAYGIARQKGVDVVLSIVAPGGETLLTADRPNSVLGPEPPRGLLRHRASTPSKSPNPLGPLGSRRRGIMSWS
jgi:hypothetical protein